jgi:hypothetical protein
MTDVRRRAVALMADIAVAIEGGLILPAGKYPGVEMQFSMRAIGGRRSIIPPEYLIELSPKQIVEMGGKATRHEISREFDVTHQVRMGRLKVA